MTNSSNEQNLTQRWLQEHEQQLAKQKEEAHQIFTATLPRLVELGVTDLRIEYDGSCDSGCVEDVFALAGEEKYELPDDLTETLTGAAENLLPSGYEINDGGYGAIVLDVADRRLTLEHYWRIQETEYEEEGWTL